MFGDSLFIGHRRSNACIFELQAFFFGQSAKELFKRCERAFALSGKRHQSCRGQLVGHVSLLCIQKNPTLPTCVRMDVLRSADLIDKLLELFESNMGITDFKPQQFELGGRIIRVHAEQTGQSISLYAGIAAGSRAHDLIGQPGARSLPFLRGGSDMRRMSADQQQKARGKSLLHGRRIGK